MVILPTTAGSGEPCRTKSVTGALASAFLDSPESNEPGLEDVLKSEVCVLRSEFSCCSCGAAEPGREACLEFGGEARVEPVEQLRVGQLGPPSGIFPGSSTGFLPMSRSAGSEASVLRTSAEGGFAAAPGEGEGEREGDLPSARASGESCEGKRCSALPSWLGAGRESCEGFLLMVPLSALSTLPSDGHPAAFSGCPWPGSAFLEEALVGLQDAASQASGTLRKALRLQDWTAWLPPSDRDRLLPPSESSFCCWHSSSENVTL